MHRPWLLLFLLGAVATADDEVDWLGEPEKPVSRARQLRAKADDAMKDAAAALELLANRKPVPPEEASKAVAALEDVVFHLERSLEVEWSRKANEQAAEAVKAWFKLRASLPEPTYPNDEAKEKAEKAEARERRSRLRDARRLIMDYGKARSFRQLFQRCSKCDGRGELYSALDKKRWVCKGCNKQGSRLIPRNLIKGQWLVHSPLYRADGRNAANFVRKIKIAQRKADSLAPFVRSTSIQGKIADHDTWVQVATEEKVHENPHAKRFDEVEQTYRLYRVGRVWYLHHPRYDREALVIPEEEGEEE